MGWFQAAGHVGVFAYLKTLVGVRGRRVLGQHSYMCCSGLKDSGPLSLSSAELTPPHDFSGL